MLQQPSELIMYQKFPLDLNMHSAEVSNLQSDFKDISLQLQAQRATGTQAFFFDAYSVKAAVPSSVVAAALPVGVAIQGAYDYPFQAVYDDSILLRRQQHHYLHQQQQQQQQKSHDQHEIQQQQLEQNHAPSYMESWQQQQQQQQQRQQLEKRGCWFPNWQEVFQGFPGSKEDKQGMLSSFQHQPTERDSVKIPSVASTVGFKKTQQLNVCPDSGEVLDVRPLSPHLHSHAATPSLHVNVPELHYGHFDRAGTNGLSEHAPPSSNLATAIVPCNASPQEKRSESFLVPFTDMRDPSLPSSAGDIACRYITQSPAWLPKGWITEVQTRRSGTTAGTRDKYYKDLVSGRRFRSRNEVIHFLQTGKGRHRRRRHRRAIASSAFGSHVNLLTNEPQPLTQQETSAPCVFLAPRPIGFVLGPLVNRQAIHSQPSMSHAVAQEVEAPCQAAAANSDVSSTPCANHQSEEQSPRVMFGLKRPVESRPQKSPVHKKAKIMSPKKCEDKQASRLWQWLHKPAARTDDQLLRQDAQKPVSMAEEKKAPDIQVLGRELSSMQSTAQLSRDIEVAQRTITELGKEMQATIERLTQRVQTAQRDLKLEGDPTHKADNAMSIVMQATSRLDSAVGNLTEATQSLVFVLGSAMHASEAHTFKVGTTLPPAEQLQAAATGVVQRALWPDVAMVQSASSSHTASAAERTDHSRGNAMQAHMLPNVANTYASVPMHRPGNLRACITQEAQLSDVFVRYSEPSHWPDNQVAYITQAAQLSHVFAHYATQRAQRPDLAMRTPTKISQSSIIATNYTSTEATTTGIVIDATGTTSNAEKLRGDENAYQKALEVSKQILETRSMHVDKFAALNPELDLSLLSPSLSSRQRAKEVQKMKAKHARGLLVILGRKLCYEAIHKGCEDDGFKQ